MKFLLPILAASPFVALTLKPSFETPEPSDLYFWAIRRDDLANVRELVKSQGVQVSDSLGNTPLMYAALDGSPACMRILLDAGADPNQAAKDGAVPLILCAGDTDKVQQLLAHGAKVNVQSKDGVTPLMIAVSYDGDGRTVQMLLDRGADLSAKDLGEARPIHYAAGSNAVTAAKLLLARGADVNQPDRSGNTPLIDAAGNGFHNEAMVKLLLAHGAKVNVVTKDKAGGGTLNGAILIGRFTPLHLAAQNTFGAAKALVDAGADVNAQDIRNANPLAFAAAVDHVDPRTIRLLVAHGAQKEPAISWAEQYKNPAVLSALGVSPAAGEGVKAEVFGGHADETRIRNSIVAALAACQPPAAAFEKKGGCFSCHAQFATGVAVSKAKALGLQADYKLESAQTARSMTLAASSQSDMAQLQGPGGGSHSVANQLLQLKAAGSPPSLTTDSMIHYLLASQQRQGDWPAAAYTRPPFEEGSFNVTAQVLMALHAYPVPSQKREIDARTATGVKWLERNAPLTTDDRAMQLLGLCRVGVTAPESRVRQLIAKQRTDGGWGETDQLPSDAYSTAECLMALHEAGLPPSDPVMQRSIQYLLNTQHSDGTWHVVSRSFKFQPYFESGFPYGPDQWISQEGTALAATALAETLGAR